jgi:deoxyribodipyrimidine photo-lyase
MAFRNLSSDKCCTIDDRETTNVDMTSPLIEDRSSILTQLAGCFLGEPHARTLPGGRTEGLRRLQEYDPTHYGRTRNFLDAPVSRLSPYLRHGMLSLVEVHAYLKEKWVHQPKAIEELLRQLAWRDYFEKVLAWHGRGIEDDLEEPKHTVARSVRIPLDVLRGATGLPCIDGMLHDLFNDGYLHNHERLWFAAYLCHFRGFAWQQGAKLFRQYLYDGDTASNSSSWQWVESTFASKTYFMNRENIATFSKNRWCEDCRVKCPFDADYPTLQHRLFGGNLAPLASKVEQENAAIPPAEGSKDKDIPCGSANSDLVWIHDAALSHDDPALKSNPNAAVAFIFDRPLLQVEPWAYHRIAFVLDGIDDVFSKIPNSTKLVQVGDLVELLTHIARSLNATTIHLSEHPNLAVVETAHALRSQFQVVVHARPTLTQYADEPRRFSRYWDKVGTHVLGYKPQSNKRWHK